MASSSVCKDVKNVRKWDNTLLAKETEAVRQPMRLGKMVINPNPADSNPLCEAFGDIMGNIYSRPLYWKEILGECMDGGDFMAELDENNTGPMAKGVQQYGDNLIEVAKKLNLSDGTPEYLLGMKGASIQNQCMDNGILSSRARC